MENCELKNKQKPVNTCDDLSKDFKEYLELLSEIKRDGIDNLLEFIYNSDFSIAPASTQYHLNSEGGLLKHSLNVYKTLKFFVNSYHLNYSEDSIRLVSLLHDISKVNFYEKSIKNQKLYSPEGSKFDDIGKFDWVSVMSYRVKDSSQRVTMGDHGFNSFMIITKYIPLSEEEIVAIVNHHSGMDSNCSNRDMNSILNKYPLAALLHLADMASTYLTENQNVRKYKITDEENNK